MEQLVKVRAIKFKDDADILSKISELVGDTIKVDYSVDPPVLKLEKDGDRLEVNVGNYVVKGNDDKVWTTEPDFFESFFEAVKIDGDTSDGYHTFNELYYHRMVLFSVICDSHRDRAWKSKLHADGTMYDDYFIVGIRTPQGDYSYHYHMDHWDMFDVVEYEKAPEWDGHKPSDITRLLTL